jgi:molybdopterin-guanine dinucleotide biosynthesis protein A
MSLLQPDSTVFILAGGRSTRMGADKAFLRLGGPTLLEHLIAVAKKVSTTIALVGDSERLHSYGSVIEDTFVGQGPLAGIHAALTSRSAKDLNLFLAVDLPNVTANLLRYLLKLAAESHSVVTVPYINGFSQTLCAVYRKEFATVAEQALKVGNNKIDPLYAEVPTRRVEEPELANLGFSPEMFDNVNTPEEWERFQRTSEDPNG